MPKVSEDLPQWTRKLDLFKVGNFIWWHRKVWLRSIHQNVQHFIWSNQE